MSLLDLGVGNLHSLAKAFALAVPGAAVALEPDTERALASDLLVLPGVGAWGAFSLADNRASTLYAALDGGHPCVGICLGMQLLFERSEEGPGAGIGFFQGAVTRIQSPRRPHMGWSRVNAAAASRFESGLPGAAYFAHSFACRPADAGAVLATTVIDGDAFAVVVKKQRTLGCQFHPEKSGVEGLRFLRHAVRELLS